MTDNDLAYGSPEEIIFGKAKYPLEYGLGLKVGYGEVIPEIKYWPYRGYENDEKKLIKEYEKITREILERAVDLNVKSLQLETELSYFITLRPKLAEEIVSLQKDIMEGYHSRYGIKLALRVTPADIRKLREVTYDEARNIMMETFEAVCRSGADVISIESIGGKEVFDYAFIRGDLEGIIFSLAILAIVDMDGLWKDIVNIAKRHKVVPGGDTACGFANTAMILAGGKVHRRASHVLAAVIRAMSASRTLVAYEKGAKGPGKDCAYENVMIKFITGYPMSMEGKTSAVAHSSLVGNIVAAVCDLWSNEQVENIQLFSGSAPQAILEMLYYDVKLMNTAIAMGREFTLRDLLISSDKFEDPQALILSPDVAWDVAKTIVKNKEDTYWRTIRAGIKALEIIERAYEERRLRLDTPEIKYLNKLKEALHKIPERDEFIDKALSKYTAKVREFNPAQYGL
ncbi:MAG: methanol--corrinoid methyltransferase [Thermoprotei archaeon]|nr:MAG: methanol--corrinoid methyltransferase [Thermoprotei archaeon]